MPVFFVILLALVGVLAALFAVCCVRAALLKARPGNVEPLPLDAVDAAETAQKLAALVRCATVSNANSDYSQSIKNFHGVLADTFPLFHKTAVCTDIDGNLLFCWQGCDPAKKPLLFMAHQDVVEAPGEWTHPAFSGDIADGRVWGRGTLDSKCNICGLLCAAEKLMARGFVPARDIWFAFGCTEEIGGSGAPATAAYLKEKGIEFELVLDEGGCVITEAPFPGIDIPYAVIGIMEKGMGNFRFTACSDGGHSSTPPKNTPIARLAAFVNEIETHPPFVKKITPPIRDMLGSFVPNMSFTYRLLLGNLWLFGGLFAALAGRLSPTAAAMLQTTCVFTMAEGSKGYNVIPQSASVTANSRFMVHQNRSDTLKLLSGIAARYNITTELLPGSNDCSAVSDTSTPAYRFIAQTAKRAFVGAGVAPYVVLGGTDARFYADLCPTVLRFAPFRMDARQMASCHAKDENISIDSLAHGVAVYEYILENFQ